MTTRRQRLGAFGERLAASRLQEMGYRILERNYRCPVGEIDIVAMDRDVLALVEVRTRRGHKFGTPEESVTARKRQKLIELAQTYVGEHDYAGHWRIDVVAVDVGPDGQVQRCEVIPDAVQG